MRAVQSEELTEIRCLHFILDLDSRPATYTDILSGWQNDANFCSFFNALLADCPAGTSAFQIHEEGKWLCNLYQLAHLRLSQLGIDKIYGGEYCTFTQRDLFYSYRRDNTTGRMATLIWMTS